MNFHLFHNFCQFLWLLVINIQCFVVKGFSKNPSNYSPRGCGGFCLVHIPINVVYKIYKILLYNLFGISRFILELTPYIILGAINWCISPPLYPKITLKVVIFRLAHGHSCESMVDCFNVVASTIRKYTKIIVKAIA
jgi:hypothetical protein